MLDNKIENTINRWTHHLVSLGHTKSFINQFVAGVVRLRGRVGTGKFACTCNNWGPRFIEDSQNGCCPGCFALALECDQEMKVNGVKPVTMAMIERSTWGFNVARLKELKAGHRLA